MKRFLVSILLIICLIILNNKIKDKIQKDLHEGFTQCEYRKKQNTGKMCKEKWGEPECSQWKPTKRLIKLEKHHSKPHNHFVSLRGYQSNSFLYEIDYDEENEVEEGGEEEGGKEEDGKEEGRKEEGGEEEVVPKKVKKASPKGIHSSYFS